MGGGIYKQCLGEENDSVRKESSIYVEGKDHKYSKGKANQKVESLNFYYINNLDKVFKIQNIFNIWKSQKLLKEIAHNKAQEFDLELKNFGFYVSNEEIFKRRSANLLKAELLLPKFNVNLSESKLVKNKILNKLTINKEPIILSNDNQRIYEGSWSLSNFYKFGLGSLYEIDGTKIEGYWNNLSIDGIGRIYYNDKSIYEGQIKYVDNLNNGNNNSNNLYVKHGSGTLYYSNGRNITGTFSNGNLSGNFVEYKPNHYKLQGSFDNEGNLYTKKAIIEYFDGSTFTGEINNKKQKHGNGLLILSNGQKFQGSFKYDKPDGLGVHFYPKEIEQNGKSEANNNNIKNEKGIKYNWGEGTYIDAKWSNGELNGNGCIISNKDVKQATWRLGKLISINFVKITLHENIFNFLEFSDLIELAKLNNKAIFKYLSLNNYDKLIKIRLLELLESNLNINNQTQLQDKLISTKMSNLLNENRLKYNYNKDLYEILKNSKNLESIFKNFIDNIDELVPLCAFYTNGGCINRNNHYSNIFNPNNQKIYFTNYNIKNTERNISIYGVLNQVNYENNKSKLGNLIPEPLTIRKLSNKIGTPRIKISTLNTKKTMKNILLFFDEYLKNRPITISNIPDIKQLYKISNSYTSLYDYKDYSSNYQNREITDFDKLKSITDNSKFNFNNYLFTCHSLLISIPFQVEKYVIIYNPVKTFAVYIYYNKDNKEDVTQDFKKQNNNLISYENVHNINIESPDFLNKLKNEDYSIINLIKNEDYCFIEFDTCRNNNDNFNKAVNEKELLCLIQLRKGEEFAFEFKKYYHLGNYIEVVLLDQNERYKTAKTIEIGSLNFFGQIYKL